MGSFMAWISSPVLRRRPDLWRRSVSPGTRRSGLRQDTTGFASEESLLCDVRDPAGEIGLAARDDIVIARIRHAGGEDNRRRQIHLVRDIGGERRIGLEKRDLVLLPQNL